MIGVLLVAYFLLHVVLKIRGKYRLSRVDMDSAYKVLEDQKEALENLLVGYREKLELSNNLKKAYDELFPKFQEARQEIDRQQIEIDVKLEEIFLLKTTCEDLKAMVHDKECTLRQVSSAYEQNQVIFRQKVDEVEGQNIKLAAALHEANEKVEEKEKKMKAYEKEIDGLKALLSGSLKRCAEAEKKVQAAKELRECEEVILKVEQGKAKIEEQLKWKMEQFKHLEEAHGKLQTHFLQSDNEWKAEKCQLIDTICTLQSNLDSKARTMENLESRLQMCNQALAYEESRRKLLEIHISDSRVACESAVMECEELKLKIEKLTHGRDDDIAGLRNMLSVKESQHKEIEIQMSLLEQENQDLKAAMKELTFDLEAQHNAKDKTKKVELSQKCNFIQQLDQKNRKIGELQHELAYLREVLARERQLKLDAEVQIKELRMEDEAYTEKLEAAILSKDEITDVSEKQKQTFSQEMYMMERMVGDMKQEFLHFQEALLEVGILRSDVKDKISSFQSRFENAWKELEDCIYAKRDTEKLLEKQRQHLAQILNLKDDRFVDLSSEIVYLKESVVEMSKSKFDAEHALKSLEYKNEAVVKEVELLSQVKMQTEVAFEEEKQRFSRELELKHKNIVKLSEEISELQKELKSTKNWNEITKAEISSLQEEYNKIIEELRTLIQQKERMVEDLEQVVTHIQENAACQQAEATASARMQANNFLEKETCFLRIIEEKDSKLKGLSAELNLLEQKYARKEIEAMVTLEQAREQFNEMCKEKDKLMYDIRNMVLSQEQLTKSVEMTISLEHADGQFETDSLDESLKRFVEMHFLYVYQNELANLIKDELEQELQVLNHRFDLQQKLNLDSKDCIKMLQHELEEQVVKFEDVIRLMHTEEQSSISDKNRLQSMIMERDEHIMLLMSERESMLSHMIELTEEIGKLSSDEEEPIRSWQTIIHDFCRTTDSQEDFIDSSHLQDIITLKQKFGIASEVRLPLKEHNGHV